MSKYLLIALIALTCSLSLRAQISNDKEIGIGINALTYQGDLAQGSFNAERIHLAFGVNYRDFIGENFALKAGLHFGQLSGSDLDYNLSRGITMENDIVEVALQVEWHPIAQNSFVESGVFNRGFSPYVGLGLGMVFTNETITSEGINLLKEEDAGSLIVLPIDLGIRFTVLPNFTATLHGGTRATFTDLLDGVSENGNSGADDWYLMGGLGLYYTW
jgi:hypothetical protein